MKIGKEINQNPGEDQQKVDNSKSGFVVIERKANKTGSGFSFRCDNYKESDLLTASASGARLADQVGKDKILAYRLNNNELAVREQDKDFFKGRDVSELRFEGEEDAPPLLMNVRVMTADEERQISDLFATIMATNPVAAEKEHKEEDHKEKAVEEKTQTHLSVLDSRVSITKETGKALEKLHTLNRLMADMKKEFSQMELRIAEAKDKGVHRHQTTMQETVNKSQEKFREAVYSNEKELNNDQRADKANQAKIDSGKRKLVGSDVRYEKRRKTPTSTETEQVAVKVPEWEQVKSGGETARAEVSSDVSKPKE